MHHIDVQCEGNIFKPGTQLRAAAWFLEIILSANVGVGMCPLELITSHMIGTHNSTATELPVQPNCSPVLGSIGEYVTLYPGLSQ